MTRKSERTAADLEKQVCVMTTTSGWSPIPEPRIPKPVLLRRAGAQLVVLLCLGVSYAAAQAAAEYGGAVAATGARTLAIPLPKVQIPPVPDGKTGSAHLVVPVDRTSPTHPLEDTEAINRKALEGRAGKDAAKMMLRSEPSKASVRIDGKPVGQTPLLLVVPPGVYKVEMEGLSTETGRRQVDLLPKETREVLLTLALRYPTHVQLRWHSQ